MNSTNTPDPSGAATTGDHDAAFLDVDEADIETSTSGDAGNRGESASIAHGDVEPGTDNEDVTVSKITDALDSDAIASSGSPLADGGSGR